MQVRKYLKRVKRTGLVTGLILIILAMAVACQSPAGTGGPSGTPSATAAVTAAAGVPTGTISGKATNSLTGTALPDVAVTVDPVIKGKDAKTDASGAYSVELPIGIYTVTYKKDNFTAVTQTVNLVAGLAVTKDMALKPTAPVVVKAGSNQEADPGSTVTLKVSAEPLDGSTVKSYQWVQTAGVPAVIDNTSVDTVKVTMAKAPDYKTAIIKGLENLDRFMVLGINPHALIAAETATFKVTVTTSKGTSSASVNVTAKLPYAFTTGLQDVPIGVPVLLHGKIQTKYNWTIAGPAGSKAEFDDPASQNPMFTPDFSGKYVLTEKTSGATLNIYAGTWSGSITGLDAKGRPVAADCTSCHEDNVAPAQFDAWANSGHAEIFTQNINNPAGHWTESCAECHSVGYNKTAKNNGFDEAIAADGWKVPSSGEVGYFNKMLVSYPNTAKLSNIQCENCHGPNNDSGLHENGIVDAARVSISSDVCGSCHGEPPRHGRFQQWEESSHGVFELAIEESGSASCIRCHTAQGFLVWLKQGDLTKSVQGKNGNATADEIKEIVTKDTALPQTCVVCHDPHEQGRASGEPNTATVRVTGSTSLLPAGFKAENVGRGAVCMTCHNTRKGLHNNSAPPADYGAPHTPAQTDVLMGENAYLVSTGIRSPHSYIKDTCATCHMEATPPPAEFSYQQSGTNHAFSASLNICSTCHSDLLDGEGLQLSFESKLDELAVLMGKYLLKKIPAKVTVLDYTPHDFGGKSYDIKSDPIALDKTNIASVETTEPHGQQGFFINLTNPVSVTYKPTGEPQHTISVKQIQVQLGDFTTDGQTKLLPTTDPLVKAGWNYFLLHGDGSKGIHHPDFSFNTLIASIESLK